MSKSPNRIFCLFFNELLTVLTNVASTLKTLFICKFFVISFLTGKLVLTAYKKKGSGGAMMFVFKCCGCWTTEVDYKSSLTCPEFMQANSILGPIFSIFHKWAWVC